MALREKYPAMADIPTADVLTAALAAGLADVVVIGTQEDGTPYIASSVEFAEANLLIDEAKYDLLKRQMGDPPWDR